MQNEGGSVNVEQQRQPLGSLLLHSMGHDSIPHRARRKGQIGLVDRSLPNTPFSLYPDEPWRTRLVQAGGKRHIETKNNGNLISFSASGEVVLPRKPVPKLARSHFDNSMQITHGRVTPVRVGRQRCREPPFERRAASEQPQRMTTPSPLRCGHLELGSLLPGEESPKKRQTPPPMVKKPVRRGTRCTPLPRSMSVEHRHVGVKRVSPQPHWITAEERFAKRFGFCVGRDRSEDILSRNHSNWSIGFVSPQPTSRPPSAVSEGRVERDPVPQERSVRQGKSRSATPRRRNFDIISGMSF